MYVDVCECELVYMCECELVYMCECVRKLAPESACHWGFSKYAQQALLNLSCLWRGVTNGFGSLFCPGTLSCALFFLEISLHTPLNLSCFLSLSRLLSFFLAHLLSFSLFLLALALFYHLSEASLFLRLRLLNIFISCWLSLNH